MNFLLVFIGGGIGSLFRYILGSTFGRNYPYGITMLINIISCFLIGILFGFILHKSNLNKGMSALLITGFCGGFSTLSAYSLDVVNLYRDGNYILAFLYLVMTIILCISATVIGIYIVKNV